MTTTDNPGPLDVLLNLVVILLAPVFLGVTNGDVSLARMAALETINDYRARNSADLIAVGQIVMFGLAAMGSLSLSMADELPLSMTLRLRGNAVSCNRASEQNRRARSKILADQPQTEPPTPQAEAPIPELTAEPEPFLSAEAFALLAAEAQARIDGPDIFDLAPTPTPAETRTPEEKRHQRMWSIVMAKEASELQASIPSLPPAEREAATVRVGLMGSAVDALINGAPPPR
jgi:hypothetical protein